MSGLQRLNQLSQIIDVPDGKVQSLKANYCMALKYMFYVQRGNICRAV
jgi:hypothetical protein